MHDVVVYLSSLPRIADRERKVQVLRAFAQGCRNLGLDVVEQTTYNILPAKLAVIIGWVGTKIKGPHIMLRKSVIDTQLAQGQHVMPIDGSCFKFADPNGAYLRYSIDGIYYGSSNYANKHSTPDKWHIISKNLNLRTKPWRSNGNHILLCLQRDTGWSMKGVDMTQWALDTVSQIRQYSDRPIVVRPHPKNPVDHKKFQGLRNLQFTTNSHLQQDLENAWSSVFFNSSASVASVLAGVPIFVSDADCVSVNVSNLKHSLMESPQLPDREQWLYDLSACHWTDSESVNGLVYQKFAEFL